MIKAGKAGTFKWSPKGYRAVMTSPGVEADLERRSEAAARAANQPAGLPDGMIAFLNMFAHIVSVKSSEIVTICYRL